MENFSVFKIDPGLNMSASLMASHIALCVGSADCSCQAFEYVRVDEHESSQPCKYGFLIRQLAANKEEILRQGDKKLKVGC